MPYADTLRRLSRRCLPAVAAGVMLLTSCRRTAGPDGEGAPIRFAYQNRVGSALPIVAVDRGMFAAAGLTVDGSRFSSGPSCAEALFTGAADIGAMGDTTAILALARNAPLRIVASHACGEHRHRLIVPADSPLQTVADLVGKRVAIKKGTSTYGGFLRCLEDNGIAPDEVQVIDLKPGVMAEALAAGSVDAFAASEPTPSLGEMRGGRELATFGGLGNTYPILLLARKSFAEERPEDLRRFLGVLAEAGAVVQQDPRGVVPVIAAATGLPVGVAAQAMARHSYRLNLDPETTHSLRKTAEFLVAQGAIETVPELNTAPGLLD